MKILLRVIALLLLAGHASGQWYTVTHSTGTATYGSTSVNVAGSGTASIYTSWCGAGPYWIGAGTGSTPMRGAYTFTLTPAATSVKIDITAADPGESIAIAINGVHYSLTAAEFIAWTGGCATSSMALSGDTLLSSGYNSSGKLAITYCPINTIEVSTDGVSNGSVFTFMFSDSGSCSNATNNSPCYGDTLKLALPGDSTAATYAWTGPGGFTSALQRPFVYPAAYTDSGLYRVIKTVGAAHDTQYTRVVIHYKPDLTLSYNNPLCMGMVDTLRLSAIPDSPGVSYSWIGPAGFSSTLEFPTVNGFTAFNTGLYTVFAVTTFGCKDTASINVSLTPQPPRPAITGVTTYCTGQPFVPFTVAATGTLRWYTTGSGGTGSTTPITVNTTVPGVSTVWVCQVVGGCESLRDSITVRVHPTPSPPVITGADTYCQYFAYIPPTATGINLQWYTSATGGTGSITVPTINTNVPGVYTIYATQTDTGCESPRASFTITVNPKPAPPVIIDNPHEYCAGQTFVPFTIISGIGILWYTVPTGGGAGSVSPPVINTSIPGSDTAWATQTVLGCESDRSYVVVTIFDKIISNFDYTIKYGCKADTVLFANRSVYATNYDWEFGDGFSSVAPNPAHVYMIQAIDTVKLYSINGSCIDSTIKTIDLRHALQAKFSVDSPIICQGKAVTFSDASTGASAYTWHFGDGTTSAAANPPAHQYAHTGVYKAFEVVGNFIPCYDTMYQTISVDTISPVHIDVTDPVLCRGGIVTFTGKYSDIGNTGIIWDFGNGDVIRDKNPLIRGFNGTGAYTVTATALYRACPDVATNRVVTVLPQPVITLGADTSICAGGVPLALIDNVNSGNSRASWEWNTGATTAGIMVTQPGTYTATVQIDGCRSSASVKVSNDCYMIIPSVFSPNADGINDFFYPRDYLTKGLISFKMDIFNRWGGQVFHTSSIEGRGWDGKLNNIDQPEGVYIYQIEGIFKDGQQEKHQGNVTLLR